VKAEVQDEKEIESGNQCRVRSGGDCPQQRIQQGDVKEKEESEAPAVGQCGQPGEYSPFMTSHGVQLMNQKEHEPKQKKWRLDKHAHPLISRFSIYRTRTCLIEF